MLSLRILCLLVREKIRTFKRWIKNTLLRHVHFQRGMKISANATEFEASMVLRHIFLAVLHRDKSHIEAENRSDLVLHYFMDYTDE